MPRLLDGLKRMFSGRGGGGGRGRGRQVTERLPSPPPHHPQPGPQDNMDEADVSKSASGSSVQRQNKPEATTDTYGSPSVSQTAVSHCRGRVVPQLDNGIDNGNRTTKGGGGGGGGGGGRGDNTSDYGTSSSLSDLHLQTPPDDLEAGSGTCDSLSSDGSGRFPTAIYVGPSEVPASTTTTIVTPADSTTSETATEGASGGQDPTAVPQRTSGVARGASPAARGRVLQRPFMVPRDPQEGEEPGAELFPEAALATPIAALRLSKRRLSLMLNIEQVESQESGDYPPDYRGLADMLGFEAVEIQNFWERDPCDTLFMDWSKNRDSNLQPPVLRTLVNCLRRLHRHDVLEDCKGLILEDVRDYLAEQDLLRRYTVNRLQNFDCYVNIAEQDILTIGRQIIDTLEGVYNLRLCLTLRDVTLGGDQYEKMAEMLETRCNSKVLIVLTKNYENSKECQFLGQFAVTLDPGSQRNKLLPLLVDECVVVPRTLRCLAMLNYHRDRKLGFLWPRLVQAISQ